MDRSVLQNTADVCEKDYLIEESMVDKAGKVTCSTLARFMQDMTTVHMNQAGISVDSLMAENLLWVIVSNTPGQGLKNSACIPEDSHFLQKTEKNC